jgi:high affinity Mn2+ porin
MRVLHCHLIFLLAALFFCVANARADDPSTSAIPSSSASEWNNHFQITTVTQTHFEFNSPYSGQNSVQSVYEIPTSLTSTIFVGHTLWKNAFAFVNGEESGGAGIAGTHGIAGFPNGEIYRVDDPSPKMNLARFFLEQDFNLGGPTEKIEDAQDQFPLTKDIRRVTLVAGRFSLNDYFDNNEFSHDARNQFLNWSLMDNGAWDYAADTRGYTWGFYGELHLESWAFRLAIVEVPAEANQLAFDGDVDKANAINAETEYRYQLGQKSGITRLLGYVNHAHMGSYEESLAVAKQTGGAPDIVATRAYRYKYGFGLNTEQVITHDLGVFARLGWNDGASETWAFTEVDRTISAGLSLKGTSWQRPDDTFGFALIANGLSQVHEDYLKAGGYGFMIGDGALNDEPEEILETYYRYQLLRYTSVTGDFQFVNHPGYNADRGPIPIFGLRLHAEI